MHRDQITAALVFVLAILPRSLGVLIPDAFPAVPAAGSNYAKANLETTTDQLLSPDLLREDLEFLFRTVEESHPNIYAHLTKDQYSRVKAEIRRQVAHSMSLSDFYIHVSMALSCIQDTHTRVERPAGFKMPPITESMSALGDRLKPLLKNDAEPEGDAPYLPAPRKAEYTLPFSYRLIPKSNACLMVVNSFGEPYRNFAGPGDERAKRPFRPDSAHPIASFPIAVPSVNRPLRGCWRHARQKWRQAGS
jgi:hypothetical protein